MKKVILPAVAVLLAGLAQAALAEPPEKERGKELAALEQKLLGAWKGQTGCSGNFLFRADRTYELTAYGPDPYDSAGVWRVRWDALPPTLVLTCKTSEVEEEIGKTTELRLLRLDEDTLTVKRENPDPDRYARAKK